MKDARCRILLSCLLLLSFCFSHPVSCPLPLLQSRPILWYNITAMDSLSPDPSESRISKAIFESGEAAGIRETLLYTQRDSWEFRGSAARLAAAIALATQEV